MESEPDFVGQLASCIPRLKVQKFKSPLLVSSVKKAYVLATWISKEGVYSDALKEGLKFKFYACKVSASLVQLISYLEVLSDLVANVDKEHGNDRYKAMLSGEIRLMEEKFVGLVAEFEQVCQTLVETIAKKKAKGNKDKKKDNKKKKKEKKEGERKSKKKESEVAEEEDKTKEPSGTAVKVEDWEHSMLASLPKSPKDSQLPTKSDVQQ